MPDRKSTRASDPARPPSADTQHNPDATRPAPPRPPRAEGGQRTFPFLSPALQPDELGQLGDYRALELLGEGGMGLVFRAEDKGLLRTVALKVIRPEVAAEPNARERFLREGRATAALKSDRVITIYQVGEANGVAFLAMEFLEGSTLEDWLKARNGVVSIPAVLRVAKDALKGLVAAHEKGLVHRDIKPANLWVEAESNRVKLLDFGLTRTVGKDHNLTQQGAVVGTPSYMAPEQAEGKPVDGRADLFSLGVVLYRMLSGKSPFERDSIMATLISLAVDEVPPTATLRPGIPRELAQLIDRLLLKSPDQRPQSAQEVLTAVTAIERQFKPGVGSPSDAIPTAPARAVPVRPAPPTRSRPVEAPIPTAPLPKVRAPERPIFRPPHAPTPAPRSRWPFLFGASVFFLSLVSAIVAIVKWGMPRFVDEPPVPVAQGGPVSPWRGQHTPGEEREFVIAEGVKMRFCWVPPGQARLGSPEGEMGRHPDEHEHEFSTVGYWLGKYEVTQEEWAAVMGDHPSVFNETKMKDVSTLRFPVDSVSWNDCQRFLEKVNERGGAAEVLGGNGRFGLPHEDEWEYACRGGKGNQQPYYWGDKLDGTQANCEPSTAPGKVTRKRPLARPKMVGSYEKDFPHPWGLCDMHGNVSEWCSNEYSKDHRVLRGGSWFVEPVDCRAARRDWGSLSGRVNHRGFRVCFRIN